LTIACTAILFARYPYNFTHPNFYAEDGSVMAATVLQQGPVAALAEPFNGYLVVGQYLITEAGFALNAIVGDGVKTLPKALAVVSYLFIGACCALPWLLFRRVLGIVLTLILVLLFAFVPVGGWDYTIFGTIGNLKFLFFYIAALLVVYRNTIGLVKDENRLKLAAIDAVLLLCVLTNIMAVVVLPFALWRYRATIADIFRRRFKGRLNFGQISLIALLAFSFIYFVIVLGKDTSASGYLDGPLLWDGAINSLFRGSLYGLLFPIFPTLNIAVVIALLFVVPSVLMYYAKDRMTVTTLLAGIFLSTVLFVVSRPGVTGLMQQYTRDGGPAHFFYASAMVFTVAVAFVVAPYLTKLSKNGKIIISGVLGVYLIWAVPLSGSFGASRAITAPLPTFLQAAAQACTKQKDKDRVNVQVYPSSGWTIQVKRTDVCQ
jgi:hypothetical protein